MLCDRRSPRVFHQDRMVQLREPTLREALADPIVQAMMQADGVDSRELKAMLTSIVAPLNSPFVPAKAGTQATDEESERVALGSRFRGNERVPLAALNDASPASHGPTGVV